MQVLQRYDTSVPNPWEGLGEAIGRGYEFGKSLKHKQALLEYDLEKLKVEKKNAATNELTAEINAKESVLTRRNTMVEIARKQNTTKGPDGREITDEKGFWTDLTDMLAGDEDVVDSWGGMEKYSKQAQGPIPQPGIAEQKGSAEIRNIESQINQRSRQGVMQQQMMNQLFGRNAFTTDKAATGAPAPATLRGGAEEGGILGPGAGIDTGRGGALRMGGGGQPLGLGAGPRISGAKVDSSGKISFDITDPKIKAQQAFQQKAIETLLKTEEIVSSTRNQFKNLSGLYFGQFDEQGNQIAGGVIDEMGGLGKTPLSARLKGKWTDMLSKYSARTPMPQTRAFNLLRQTFGLALASLLNRGRPSDRDFEAAIKAVFSTEYTLATSLLLHDYVQKALDSNNIEQLQNLWDNLFVATDEQGNELPGARERRDSFHNSLAEQGKRDERNVQTLMNTGKTRAEAEQYIYEFNEEQYGGGVPITSEARQGVAANNSRLRSIGTGF